MRTLPRASLVNIDRQGYTDISGLLKGVRAGGDGRVCVSPPSDVDVHILSRTYVGMQALNEPNYNTLSLLLSFYTLHSFICIHMRPIKGIIHLNILSFTRPCMTFLLLL